MLRIAYGNEALSVQISYYPISLLSIKMNTKYYQLNGYEFTSFAKAEVWLEPIVCVLTAHGTHGSQRTMRHNQRNLRVIHIIHHHVVVIQLNKYKRREWISRSFFNCFQ